MRDSPPTFLVFWIAVLAFLGWPAMAFAGTGAIAGEVLWLAFLALAVLVIPGTRGRVLPLRPHRHHSRGHHLPDRRTPAEEHADLLARRKAAVQARAAAQKMRLPRQ